MKKSLIAILALVLSCVMLFAACGDKAEDKDADKAEETTAAVSDETTAAPTDETTAPAEEDTTAAPEVDVPAVKTDAEKVADYVAANGDDILAAFDAGFSGSGLTTTSTIEAVGTGIVLKICINELDNLTDDQRTAMQSSFNQLSASLGSGFDGVQAEIPELTYIKFDICEKNGTTIIDFTFDGSEADAPATDVPSTAVGGKSYALGSEEEGEMIILGVIYDANGYVTKVVYAMAAEIGVSTSDAETLEYTFTTIKGKFEQLKSDGGNATVEYEADDEGYLLKAEFDVSNEVEAAFAADMFGVANNGALVKFADVDASLLADGFTEYTE